MTLRTGEKMSSHVGMRERLGACNLTFRPYPKPSGRWRLRHHTPQYQSYTVASSYRRICFDKCSGFVVQNAKSLSRCVRDHSARSIAQRRLVWPLIGRIRILYSRLRLRRQPSSTDAQAAKRSNCSHISFDPKAP